MTLLEAVRSILDDEPVLDRVPLGGDSELFVTSARLLRYRGEGLLSAESVEEYPREANRISVSEGRRTTAIALEYAGDERTLSVPADRVEAVLDPLLAGALSADGVVDGDERIVEAFQFDELTAVVTDRRLIEHVGTAVWDGEYGDTSFEDVTGLEIERGRVATGIVLTADGRRERIKVRNECAQPFEERLRGAIRAYHGVESIDELAVEETEPDDPPLPIASVDPLTVDRSTEAGVDDWVAKPCDSDGIDAPKPGSEPAFESELEALSAAIERQETLLAEQRRTIDRLREITRARDR